MSEKLYACLLRLVAPHFYRVYGEEAVRLVRDCCRDEKGVVSKIGIWLDLLADLAVAALRDDRFKHQAPLSQLAAAHGKGQAPSFAVVRNGLPYTAAMLVGGAFSLSILATLTTLIGHGGGGQGTSPSLPGIFHFSVPVQRTSKDSRIDEQSRLVRAHLFGTAGVSAHLADGSLALATGDLIDTNEKKRVLNGVITNLRESYVYPNVAREMIAALLTHEMNRDYEKETTGSAFAALLTKHLQDVSHDLHLRVVFSATKVPPLGPPEADPHFQRMAERDNCAFRKVEVLPHNIGYVKFDAFGPVSLCRDTAAAGMRFLAHVDGLIFDLRENQGGDPHMVCFIASYLFDRHTHLNDIYSQLDKSTEQFWTSEDVAGPKFGKKPVYVLTSAGTFSGAEEFTYDLKNLKRAVIVGERTAGGAHLVMNHRIDDHFLVGVPFARPINPISKTDWEGTGVAPDVRVKSADALEVAEQLALRKLEHQKE